MDRKHTDLEKLGLNNNDAIVYVLGFKKTCDNFEELNFHGAMSQNVQLYILVSIDTMRICQEANTKTYLRSQRNKCHFLCNAQDTLFLLSV